MQVHPSLRQYASAGSMSAFQLFGYALSPIVSAAFAEAASGDPLAGMDEVSRANATLVARAEEAATIRSLDVALQVTMWWGCFGVIFMFGAWRFAKRAVAYGSESTPADAGDAGATPAGIDTTSAAADEPAAELERKVSGGI